MALTELRSILPHGDVGRIINSYILPGHPDTLNQIRAYRRSLMVWTTPEHRAWIQDCAVGALARRLWFSIELGTDEDIDLLSPAEQEIYVGVLCLKGVLAFVN